MRRKGWGGETKSGKQTCSHNITWVGGWGPTGAGRNLFTSELFEFESANNEYQTNL